MQRIYLIIHNFLHDSRYVLLLCLQNVVYLSEVKMYDFFSISPSPRPRASSSSSQPERGTSPLILNSTQSLESMPNFTFPEDDGNRFYAYLNLIFGKIKRATCELVSL